MLWETLWGHVTQGRMVGIKESTHSSVSEPESCIIRFLSISFLTGRSFVWSRILGSLFKVAVLTYGMLLPRMWIQESMGIRNLLTDKWKSICKRSWPKEAWHHQGIEICICTSKLRNIFCTRWLGNSPEGWDFEHTGLGQCRLFLKHRCIWD